MLNTRLSSKLNQNCGRLLPMPLKDAAPTALGLRIAGRRREIKMTQETLATKAGVTKGAVSQWETGDVTNLRLPHLFKVADALGVEPRWLALDEPPKLAKRGTVHDKIAKLAERIADLPSDQQKLLLDIFRAQRPGRSRDRSIP